MSPKSELSQLSLHVQGEDNADAVATGTCTALGHVHTCPTSPWHVRSHLACSTTSMSYVYVRQSQAPMFDSGRIHVGNDSMYWPRTWKQNETETGQGEKH